MFAKVFVLIVLLSIVQTKADDIAFIKLGSYGDSSGSTKDYFLPRHFKAHWVHTRSICKAYDMDVLSLETRAEADAFLNLCKSNASFFEQWTHIGGMTLASKNVHTWYWVNSGKRIEYALSFGQGQPDNAGGFENCLSIGKNTDNSFIFNDLNCYAIYEFKFICQKIQKVEHKDNSDIYTLARHLNV